MTAQLLTDKFASLTGQRIMEFIQLLTDTFRFGVHAHGVRLQYPSLPTLFESKIKSHKPQKEQRMLVTTRLLVRAEN